MKRAWPIILCVFTLLLAACAGPAAQQTTIAVVGQKVEVKGGFYTDINAAELQTLLEKKDFTLVNVHIPYAGNIAGTDVSIPYDQIAQQLDQLPADKSAKIVLYCSSGRMSSIAATTLVELGYTNIWNLSGGMSAWQQAGMKINR